MTEDELAVTRSRLTEAQLGWLRALRSGFDAMEAETPGLVAARDQMTRHFRDAIASLGLDEADLVGWVGAMTFMDASIRAGMDPLSTIAQQGCLAAHLLGVDGA